MAVERASRSESSPLMIETDGLCAMSLGTLSGDLANMAMLASGYNSRAFRVMRMPLAPVAPRIKKCMVDKVEEGSKSFFGL